MAESLFDSLKMRGFDRINEMIDNEQQESLSLDFKTNVEGSGKPLFEKDGKKLSKDGRRILAKASSAFANSMGGVLILGVDCRPENGVDCARAIMPIKNLSTALSTINNVLHELTTPTVNGIEAISIPNVYGQKDEGLIAISVPRSKRRPHKAHATADKSYYKRAGSSTIEMEHYELEEAFLSNVGPNLELSVNIMEQPLMSVNPPGVKIYGFRLDVLAKNLGGGIAKNLFLKIAAPLNFILKIGKIHQPSKSQVEVRDGFHFIALTGDFILLPNLERTIESVIIKVRFEESSNKLKIGTKEYEANSCQSIRLELGIAAEGMRIVNQSIEIELSELVRKGNIPIAT